MVKIGAWNKNGRIQRKPIGGGTAITVHLEGVEWKDLDKPGVNAYKHNSSLLFRDGNLVDEPDKEWTLIGKSCMHFELVDED